VEIPTNVPGWRVILTSTNNGPDLYIQSGTTPIAASFLKRSQSLTNDDVPSSSELTPGDYFIGVFLPPVAA
jgi:hypothetical protein